MVKVEIKTVKMGEIKLNPDNPRTISKKDMDLLVKSLKDFPEMLELREIVVDEGMMILGGNMRYLALQKAGVKEATAKVVTGLTPAQKREFIVKDNASFGDWNMEDLANSWADLPLADWGVKLPDDWMKADEPPEEKPESVVPEKDPNILVRVSFHPGIWLGKREEIITILEKLKKTYGCDVRIEE
jgi:hypothetical protein